MHELRNQQISIGYIFRTEKVTIVSLHGQDQKSEQKPTTKNFVGFHNHSPNQLSNYSKDNIML